MNMKGHIIVATLLSIFLIFISLVVTYALDAEVIIRNVTVWYTNGRVNISELNGCEKSLGGTRLLYLPMSTYSSITYIPSFIIPLYFFSHDTIRNKKNKSILSQYPIFSLSISVGNALLIAGSWIFNACSCEQGLIFKNSCTYHTLLVYTVTTFTLRHYRSLSNRIGSKYVKLKMILLHLFFINVSSVISFSLFSIIPVLRANILTGILTSLLLVTNVVYILIDSKNNMERGIYRFFWIALVMVLGGLFFVVMDSKLCVKNTGSSCLSYLFFSIGSCLLYLYQRSIRDVSFRMTQKNNVTLDLSGGDEDFFIKDVVNTEGISEVVLDELGEALRDYRNMTHE